LLRNIQTIKSQKTFGCINLHLAWSILAYEKEMQVCWN